MLPHIHLLGLPLPMYSVMVAVGAIACLIYFKVFMIKREKIERITENRLIFISILGFIVLGVSAFIFNSIFHSIEEGKLSFGGITWLGGVIGIIPAMYYFIHILVPKDKGNAINRFSTMLPGLVIAHAFGRLGCFFGGCCFGGRTDSFLGVSFPAGSLAGSLYPDTSSTATKVVETTNDAGEVIEKILYPSLPVLPTQLIEALFEILLFVAMILLYKKYKNYNVEIYCFVYGAFRFVLEFFRGDDRGATGMLLSPSQLMCIILWIGATFLILFRNKKVFKKLYAKCESWRVAAAEAPAGGIGSKPLFSTQARTMEAIRELYKLMEDGIITEDEFKEKKAELLKRL